jgi:hypothetical protein
MDRGIAARKSAIASRSYAFDANGKAIAPDRSPRAWLQGQQAWGRPADVLAPDGSLLVATTRRAPSTHWLSRRDLSGKAKRPRGRLTGQQLRPL